MIYPGACQGAASYEHLREMFRRFTYPHRLGFGIFLLIFKERARGRAIRFLQRGEARAQG
jgi:hypothetical protein